MAIKRITRRWLLNSFGVIVFIVLAVEIAFAFAITGYYYNYARQTLITRADIAKTVFNQYYDDSTVSDFSAQVREYVYTFEDKGKMELMTIDGEGAVVLTSSGFDLEVKDMPDYEMALQSADKTGYIVMDFGTERVMAVTALTPLENPSLSAVRFVVSLTHIDQQITILIIAMAFLGLAVLILVLFSSSYFISSIVNPVGEVGLTARKIAGGDFDARLVKKNNDEIGELCDTINYMAGELALSEQLKNEFISSVSHELRTPLTAIQGWGETLLSDDGQDKEMLQKGMSVIIGETTRLSQMVEELLDFSRMQSGHLNLITSRIDAFAELSEAVLMFTQRAQREGISLIYEDSEDIAIVNADKNRLRQVFVNIIDNAIKYSDSGGVITISTVVTSQMLTIIVADTGIGIKSEELPKVKAKFYKASSTRRGSGIGLAVADEIVSLHGGQLTIDSIHEKGTTVSITLPISG